MGYEPGKKTWNFVKRLVSKDKCRHVFDNYDLDLTYIQHNLIAMGFPASGFESVYRNSMDDVVTFFTEKHTEHYKIYNLCTERTYPNEKFLQVSNTYRFEDHQPPPFEIMLDFCRNLDNWLKSNDKNVGAVHCKAGKGRTGVMVCCYLSYSRKCKDAYEALSFYGKIRTKNGKGVTIPSQIRYIYYFDHWCKFHTQGNKRVELSTVKLIPIVQKLNTLIIITIPNVTKGASSPTSKSTARAAASMNTIKT